MTSSDTLEFFMKLEEIIAGILKYWQLIIFIGGILVFTTRTQDEIRTISESLRELNSSLKSYVDTKEDNTNTRIDSLQKNVQKLNYELLLSNQRIDTTLGKIMDTTKNTNDRLDKIWSTIYIQNTNIKKSHH